MEQDNSNGVGAKGETTLKSALGAGNGSSLLHGQSAPLGPASHLLGGGNGDIKAASGRMRGDSEDNGEGAVGRAIGTEA